MVVLPPGTLLQLMFLDERLRKLPAGRFVEIGPGSGEITNLLLRHGWVGTSYDLDQRTIAALTLRFGDETKSGQLRPLVGDYVTTQPESDMERVDLVISCMVMEHLDEPTQQMFMQASGGWLANNGIMITLVPGSPSHWGIEDEIAGHFRRYSRRDIARLTSDEGWNLVHLTGLTFPVSNVLLPISNFLVYRTERSKLKLSYMDRTKESGRRSVKFKTHFPFLFSLILNRVAMRPLHLLQKVCSRSSRALVLYFEAKPNI